MSLLAVGTMAFDDIETPYGRAEKIIGGACTYISLAASHFVRPVQVVSVVGGDFPDSMMVQLRERGVDLDGVQVRPDEKSFFWAGRYHKDMNGRDTLDTQLNVLATFDPVLPDSYRDAQYVMLGNLTPQVQIRVLDQLSTKPKLVVLDTMNFWMDIALDDLKTVLKRVDVLTINDEEARQLSGERSLLLASKKIHAMGPEFLIIKKGEHGALLFHEGRIFSAPGLLLPHVVDPTGAGDTFAGGFIGWLAKTDDISFENMKTAIIHGSAMASFCVEAFGIERLSAVTESDIKARVQEFAELVHFNV
jgi:sugar/nucleoside kinase (ribokinase family)